MVKKHKPFIFIGFIFIILFLTFFAGKNFLLISQASEAKNNLEVIFLDVGQGDAILIKTPYGQNILIDGGEDEKIIKRLGEKLPWWDKRIDLMILTHPHSDHVAGLIEVLKRYKVLKVLYTGVNHNSPDYLAWLKIINEKKIDLNIINHFQKIILGENCILEILYPIDKKDIDDQTNLNNTSIVSKLSYGQISFLFMGDIEREIENVLISKSSKLKADVLKIGHHGSDTSSSIDFLKTVQPKYAIMEVGKDNDFGHPSSRIIKRLERQSIEIFRTDFDGSIKFISNGMYLKVDNLK